MVSKDVGRQAEFLRTGMRTLGRLRSPASPRSVGLAALTDRSISAADAIGKTADKIGVGVEALQELRFRCQGFRRRAADAGHGAAAIHADALQRLRMAPAKPRMPSLSMGIALRDQSGNLRRSEDLLGDVADAFSQD